MDANNKIFMNDNIESSNILEKQFAMEVINDLIEVRIFY